MHSQIIGGGGHVICSFIQVLLRGMEDWLFPTQNSGMPTFISEATETVAYSNPHPTTNAGKIKISHCVPCEENLCTIFYKCTLRGKKIELQLISRGNNYALKLYHSYPKLAR